MSKSFYVFVRVVLASCLVFAVGISYSAEVEIEWRDWQNYRDIRPSQVETKTAFRENVFKNLGQTFEKMAAPLPADSKMTVVVTDIDLAGDASPATALGIQRIRVYKDIYPPRIAFSYELTDASGTVISQGEVNIHDSNYLNSGNRAVDRNKRFGPDQRLIERWFQKQLYPELNFSPE